jgi:uncharacterized membrane protein
MADDAVFCQACGQAVATPAPAVANPGRSDSGKVSALWWFFPIFFGVLGGALSYVAARDQNFKTARRMLILGIIMTPLVMLFAAATIMALASTTPATP